MAAKQAESVLQEKKSEIDEVFRYFDRKHNGTIELNDFGKVMRSCGFAPTNKQIAQIQEKLTKAGITSGVPRANFDAELKNYLETSNELQKTPEQKLQEAFTVLDREKRGYVLVSELRHVLTTVGETLTEQEVNEMFEKAGIKPTEEKQLNFEEFKSVFLLKFVQDDKDANKSKTQNGGNSTHEANPRHKMQNNIFTSKAASRALIIAQHLTPLLLNVFGASSTKSESQSDIQSSSSTSENFDDLKTPWIYIAAGSSEEENDDLFSKVYSKKLSSAHELSQNQLRHVLQATIQALKSHAIPSSLVQKLNLSQVSQSQLPNLYLTNTVLPALSPFSIQEINLNSCASVDNKTLESIGKNIPTLKTLIISNTNVTDDGVKQLFQHLHHPEHLKHFDANKTGIHEPETLELLFTRCNNKSNSELCMLNVDSMPMSQNQAETFLSKFSKLNKISTATGCYTAFGNNQVICIPNGNLQKISSLVIPTPLQGYQVLKNLLSVCSNPNLVEINVRLNPQIAENSNDEEHNLIKIMTRFRRYMPKLHALTVKLQGENEESRANLVDQLRRILGPKVSISLQ